MTRTPNLVEQAYDMEHYETRYAEGVLRRRRDGGFTTPTPVRLRALVRRPTGGDSYPLLEVYVGLGHTRLTKEASTVKALDDAFETLVDRHDLHELDGRGTLWPGDMASVTGYDDVDADTDDDEGVVA